MFSFKRLTIVILIGPVLSIAARRANAAEAPLPDDLLKQSRAAIDNGLAFLQSTQDRNGGWTPKYGPAITAIVGQAFAQDGRHGPSHAIVQRAQDCVLQYRQKDGGIYSAYMGIGNYQTSVAVMFLASLHDAQSADALRDARQYLKKIQYDESEGGALANPWYGGAGYGIGKRPDLSNTQMMLEALHQSGLPPTDPAFQKALRFVTRCQNLSTTNDQPFARHANDGGFIYSPAGGGQSKAGEEVRELPESTLRSYGSMTYAGLKSMLYANVSRDDPRVRAAYEWICKHYTLDANANMPPKQARQGIYYYYHVFARALYAWGEPTITDDRGQIHNWRLDLCRKLISLQRSDGSWINDADRWNEGDANYVTALAILTLETAMKK